jgi:hypothetical protein
VNLVVRSTSVPIADLCVEVLASGICVESRKEDHQLGPGGGCLRQQRLEAVKGLGQVEDAGGGLHDRDATGTHPSMVTVSSRCPAKSQVRRPPQDVRTSTASGSHQTSAGTVREYRAVAQPRNGHTAAAPDGTVAPTAMALRPRMPMWAHARARPTTWPANSSPLMPVVSNSAPPMRGDRTPMPRVPATNPTLAV